MKANQLCSEFKNREKLSEPMSFKLVLISDYVQHNCQLSSDTMNLSVTEKINFLQLFERLLHVDI